jgi:hypothetical protein
MQPEKKEAKESINVGDKIFGYNIDYDTHQVEFIDGDKVHSFTYGRELLKGYRGMLLDELKRIGWVENAAY